MPTYCEHSKGLIESVQIALHKAVELACGSYYADLMEKECPVQLTSNWRKYGDMRTTCPIYIFRRHMASLKHDREQCSENYTENEKPVMHIETTSEYGFKQPRVYESAQEIGQSIISCIPEVHMKDCIADAYVDAKSNHIIVTTRPHMNWHLFMNRIPCPICGHFSQGPRGHRTHQIAEHGVCTEQARVQALETELQVIVYTPNDSNTVAWKEEASATARARDHLGDEGLEAARRGDLSQLHILVSQSWCPLSARDKHGNTALTWAAGEGHLDVCKYLVDELGMDPHGATGARKRQRQPLHWAARNGQIAVCDWLIHTKSVFVDVGTDDGTTPLHLAIWMGKLDTVKWLVEKGGSDVNRLNGHGCNCSQWGALNGSVDILQYLKSQGLDLKVLNNNGRSALHKAAVKGNFDACRWLLQPETSGGGGLTFKHMQPEREGDTPASLAASGGHYELEAWLNNEYRRLKLLSM